MTSHQFFDFFGFIVNTKAINDSTGCFVHPADLNVCSFSAEFNNHLIQCADRRDIPEMGMRNINDNFSAASRKSKYAIKRSAEAKNTCPVTL
jgi:hypothetical protein